MIGTFTFHGHSKFLLNINYIFGIIKEMTQIKWMKWEQGREGTPPSPPQCRDARDLGILDDTELLGGKKIK